MFDRAAEVSSSYSSKLAQEYSSLLLLGKEMEEMRWFLLPYEAHLYLNGCPLPRVEIPFQPRNYEEDHWYDPDYLTEWDRHWNPSYWKELQKERSHKDSGVDRSHKDSGVERDSDVQVTCRWQWTIYPASDHTPSQKQQPTTPKQYVTGGQLAGKKAASVSMTCLYTSRTTANPIGSTASLASPLSSGYSSAGEEREEEGQKKGKRKRGRRKGHNDPKKCAVM